MLKPLRIQMVNRPIGVTALSRDSVNVLYILFDFFQREWKSAPRDPILEGLEKNTREAKQGLWADYHPVPPWE
mgnify:CR=1 FL=1